MKKNIKRAAVSLLVGALVLPASTATAAENTENTNEKWFPISVSSIDSNHNLISDFSYVYDENGRVVESPVKLSDIVNEMVDGNAYWEEFKKIADVQGTYDGQYAYNPIGYRYVYNEDGTVNEYKRRISTEAIDSYPYIFPNYADANSLKYSNLESQLMYREDPETYSVLTYSHGYLTAVTEICYIEQELWDKLFEVASLTGRESGTKEEYDNAQYYNGSPYNQYNFYYLAYGGIMLEYKDCDVLEGNEPGTENRLNTDKYDHTLFNPFTEEYYYNEYDENGNLLYRVCYTEHENVSYSQPFSSSSLMGNYEMKTVERIRNIQQIDRYTYAYGDPAKYNSDPDSFQKSICDKSLADIVNIVEGNASFLNSCTTEAAYLEQAKAGITQEPAWGAAFEEDWDEEEDWDDEEDWDEEEHYGSANDRIRTMTHY